eukprot:GFUD01121963.1.p1 GENE.GFUD01121963.1~~GFUD01121963.1.p1  ORF type:complete len:231 (-),score=88.30 GFUD01121963.1:149-790(-)
MVSLSRYWSSQFSEEGETTTPEVTKEGETSTPEVTKVGDKRRSKDTENNEAKKGKPAAKKKAEGKIDGLSLTQHRRMLGDQVRDQIEIAGGQGNWHIKAKCHVHTQMSMEAFQAVVAPGAACLTPSQFDRNTEVVLLLLQKVVAIFLTKVVLAEVRNMDQAATILGSANKLRKGTRFVHKDGSSSSWEVSTMDIVFMPKKKELRIWWTMGSGH